MTKTKVATLIFFLVTTIAEASDVSKLKPIWWFPITDNGINFVGMQQFFMDPACQRDKVIEAINKDLFVLRENGYNTVVVRVPNGSVAWQRFHGSFDKIPTHDQLKTFIEYIDAIWSAGFHVILAFDWNTDPYQANFNENVFATKDNIVPSFHYTINPFELRVLGNHLSTDYLIRVENASLVRRNQVFKVKRVDKTTGELVALGNSMPVFVDGKSYIKVVAVSELSWRASRRTGGRGFGKMRAGVIKDGDILELQGSSDWIENYLSMIMRAGDFYPNLKNLVDHQSVAGWILVGEAIFWANTSDQLYQYISHDDFYKRFWGGFYDLIKSGNAGQMAMVYSLVNNNYDSRSLDLIKNMKAFFLNNFPEKLPDLWGMELYQKNPEKAYFFSKLVINIMLHGPPLALRPEQVFVGEWAFSPATLADYLKKQPTQEDYDRAQLKATLAVRFALREHGINLNMHWGWWALRVPEEKTREEDSMGLAYPLEAFFCGDKEITGSRFYELRPAEYWWQRFLRFFKTH